MSVAAKGMTPEGDPPEGPSTHEFKEFVEELRRVCPGAVHSPGNLPPTPRASLLRRIEVLRRQPDNAGVDAMVAAWRAAAPDVEPEERWAMEELQEIGRLCDAELARIGLSAEDLMWIHTGSDHVPTREAFEEWLTHLRRLPTAMGATAYCAYLGFDYEQTKREVGTVRPDAAHG